MATQYTSLLGLALPVTGELSGTWGDTVNDSITSLLDTAVAGTTTLSTDTDVTLTTTTGATNQARQAIILWAPASGTTTRNITAPAQSKIYTVINASGGTQSIVFRGAGPTTGVTIVKGESAIVAWNGSDFIKVSNTGGSASFTNVTVSGTTTLSALTASTALALDSSKNVVSVTNTGTGNNVLSASPTLTGTISGASLQLSSLTSGRVTFAGASGLLSDAAGLTWDGTTLAASNLTDSSLTSGRVTFASTGGNLADASGLTWDGTNLTASQLRSSGLTSGRVTYASTSGLLVDSANMIFNGTRLTVADLADSGLTAGRVTYASTGGALVDSANLTFDGTNLTLGGGTANGVAYLNGSKVLTTGSALTFDGSLLTTTTFRAAGNAFFYGSTGDRLNVFPQTAGSGVQLVSTNNANSAYAPLTLDGSATIFNASGAEGMRLTSTGLGIGTSSPSAKLHVLAADATTADLARFQQTNQGNLLIQSQQGSQSLGSANGILFSNATGNMGWRTNASSGNANMLLTQGGDLGLGTVSPSAKFHAQIPAATNSNVEMLRLTDGTYADFKVLLNRSTSLGASVAQLNTATNNMAFETANTERMRLVSSELIIGGTSTGYGVGSTRQTNVASSSGIVTGLVLQNSANNTNNQGVQLVFKNSVWNGGGIEDAKAGYIKYVSASNFGEQGNLYFGTNNGYGVGPVDRMLLSFGGNLYVGPNGTNWTGGAGITLGTSTTSLDARNFVRINNRGAGASGTSHTIGGIVWSAYRDVRDPSDVAAIWAIRTAYAGGLASDGTLVFGTDLTDGGSIETDGRLPAERARITNEGNFFLGSTTGAGKLSVQGNGPSGYAAEINNTVTNNNVLLVSGTSASNSQNKIVFSNGGSVCGTVTTTATTTSYNTSSDYRLKENVAPVVGAFARIGALEPVEYNWKESGIRSRGFLAHKFQEVYPQSVSGAKDAVDAKGKPAYQTMQASTSEVIADLVACIQELKAEFDAYKATHP